MTSGAKVAFPARCAVSIGYDTHLVPQVFPAGIAVEEFFERMVELLDEDLKRRGFDGVALPPGSYELHKVNGVRLDISKSLDDLGVQDGDTLILVPLVEGDSFEPQHESLSTALAEMSMRLGKVADWRKWRPGDPEPGGDPLFRPVTAVTAARTALALLAMAGVVVAGVTLRARVISDSWVPAAVAGGVGALMLIGAIVVWRGWPDRRDLFAGFGWLAVALVSIGAAIGPPGDLGAGHGLIGAVLAALGAIAISVFSQARAQTAAATAVVTVAGLAAVVALVRMFEPVKAQTLGVGLLMVVLLLVRMTPTIALWVSQIRPPYFGSVTGRDLFARREGMPVDTVSPVVDENADEDDELTDITARGAQVAGWARLVNVVQLGMCIGISAVLPVATWMTLGDPEQSSYRWLAIAVPAITVGIFITQGRGYTAKWQSIALVVGATTAVCAGVVKYALAAPADSAAAVLLPVAVVTAFAGLGLAAALLVPATKFRPLVRLLVEWLEVLAFATLLPLAAWLGGLFTWIRP